MSTAAFLLYFFEASTALAAVSILFVRQVFYAALLLMVCLLCIAGIYVLAFAEFMAVTQILVYAGGILVVIIFGIMLTARISGEPLQVTSRNQIAGSFVGIFFFALFISLFSKEEFSVASASAVASGNTIQSIGVLLMSDFILPFEIAGILLLITLVGSAVTASFTKLKK